MEQHKVSFVLLFCSSVCFVVVVVFVLFFVVVVYKL